MIIDERMVSFINSFDSGDSDIVEEIERQAIADRVPIIRQEMGSLLKVLIALKKPSTILEVGTAVGYSSILMAENMPKDAAITTIEKYEKRIPVARENIKKAGYEDRITLIEGDAMEVMKELTGPYDMIFMDAAKGQYIHFLPEVMRLLARGGMLISDNVLQEGDIIESKFGVVRRNRTIHMRMREYIYAITHMEGLITSIVPIGDGITLSVKKECETQEQEEK